MFAGVMEIPLPMEKLAVHANLLDAANQ